MTTSSSRSADAPRDSERLAEPSAQERAPRLGAAPPGTARPELTRSVADALDRPLIDRLVADVRAGSDAARVAVTAPFDGTPLAELPQSSTVAVAGAVERARVAQRVWAGIPPRERAALLWRVHDLVLERQRQVLDLIQLECGKARVHAFEEVVDVAITASWYARHGPALLADTRHRGLLHVLSPVTEVRHPVGVVGIIAPWNYPLTLTLSDALPALLAGNAVVLKPDTRTALTVLWAGQVLADAGLPPDLMQVVVGDGPVTGTALVEAVDYVSFTGATATGRVIAQRAATRLIGCSLELGGKNGLYVAADADVERAAEAAVRDCFAGAGQVCVSMERVVLHRDVADAFLDRFIARTERLRLGTALDYSVDVGCLISDEHLRRVRIHVDDAVAKGARVLTGGVPRPDIGPLFFAPTVLADVPTTAVCHHEETFGPVVAIHRVASDDQAIALVNDTIYGLNASVWSQNRRHAHEIARRIRSGTVTVNEAHTTSWSAVAAPMGGRGESGLGRRHGAAGLLRFTESQTIAEQRVGLGPLYARGGQRLATNFTRGLRAARRARLPWP